MGAIQSSMMINEHDWTKVKRKIHAKWVKLSDSQLERLRGDLTQLKQELQKSYEYDKDAAQREFGDFIAQNIFLKPQAHEVAS